MKHLIAAVIAAAVSATAFAQPGAGPVRKGRLGAGSGRHGPPPRADAPRGTAVLRGQIVTADNGSPIRRAQVRVMSPDAREGRRHHRRAGTIRNP